MLGFDANYETSRRGGSAIENGEERRQRGGKLRFAGWPGDLSRVGKEENR